VSAVALPIRPSGPDPERLRALADAFESERRLLDDLMGVLLRQRDGLASNDVAALDDSVYAAQRVFLTIQQARRRRRTLCQLLFGREDVELRTLEDVLGDAPSGELFAARDRLLEAARRLERELRVNRRVIDGALDLGDRLIRALGGAGNTTVYAPPSAKDAKSPPAGALLNTRV